MKYLKRKEEKQMSLLPCNHDEKYFIVEREFYFQSKPFSGTRIICKKCWKSVFIKDNKFQKYKTT